MLPSTAVGTVEFRSLLEPVRVANPCECSGRVGWKAPRLDMQQPERRDACASAGLVPLLSSGYRRHALCTAIITEPPSPPLSPGAVVDYFEASCDKIDLDNKVGGAVSATQPGPCARTAVVFLAQHAHIWYRAPLKP